MIKLAIVFCLLATSAVAQTRIPDSYIWRDRVFSGQGSRSADLFKCQGGWKYCARYRRCMPRGRRCPPGGFWGPR